MNRLLTQGFSVYQLKSDSKLLYSDTETNISIYKKDLVFTDTILKDMFIVIIKNTPTIYYNDTTLEQLIKFYKNKHNKKVENKSIKNERRENFKSLLAVNDILYGTYGYDETYAEFYKVISIKNCTITVKKLTYSYHESSNRVVADVDNEVGESIRCIINDSYIKINDIYCYKWDGKPIYVSTY